MRIDRVAAQLRGLVITMSHKGKAGHLASALSCADIMAALYWRVLRIDPNNPTDPDRDRFILSKGHAASILYATLALKGYLPVELLDTYCQDGGLLAEHPPANLLPGVEAATGSLGHGLPIGVGMALAAKQQGKSYRVYVLMSDGECNEGSVWEAAMFAAEQRLDNLCVVVDWNGWQATGRTLGAEDLCGKWRAFGWDAYNINGNDKDDLLWSFGCEPTAGKPIANIARTVKGKGVSFMEDDNNWHYRHPNADEVARAHAELGL